MTGWLGHRALRTIHEFRTRLAETAHLGEAARHLRGAIDLLNHGEQQLSHDELPGRHPGQLRGAACGIESVIEFRHRRLGPQPGRPRHAMHRRHARQLMRSRQSAGTGFSRLGTPFRDAAP